MRSIKKTSILKFVFSVIATAVCQLSLAQSSASFGYSAEGKLLGVTSQRDSISIQWDALGRNSGKLINGDSYLFGYNGQGFLSSYSDPKGLNTQYSYNGFGFLTFLTSPDTGFTSFTTNLNGAPTQKATSGSVTNITYDAEDRISSKTVSHPTLGSLTYAYSYAGPGSGLATGNLTSISATGLSLSFEYDAFSQITKKIQSVSGSASLVTQYSYSAPNTLSAIGYHSGRVATYSRNAAGQITSISVDGNTIVSNIKYSPYGVAGYTFANGNTVNRTFDLQGRITSVTLATGTRSYSYDARDNLTSISDAVLGNATYSYDYQNRLISANTALGQWGYSYDANGSRTQFNINGSGYAVIVDSASNKTLGYSTPTVRSLSYNAQGHVSQITGDPANPACGSNTQTAYNANGSLTSSNTFDAVYDDFGFRLRKSASACAGGSVTLFDYGPNGMLLGEYSNTGEAIQETLWLGDIPVAVFRGIKNSEPPYFIYTDNLNTPRQIMNNSSQLVWSWDGEPFGATPANENVSPTTTFTYNLRFPGQYYDKESGLHQNRWREYDPKQGKYLQSDPLGLAAGVNTYAYVGSSPLMFVDPLGLRPLLPGERNFIKAHFGNCMDDYLDKINIHERTLGWGDSKNRAVSLNFGFVSFPTSYFVNNNSNLSLDLTKSAVSSAFGHEILHQLQREKMGYYVTIKGLYLQSKYSLGLENIYDYDKKLENENLLNFFKKANFEQQGEIFEDYLKALASGDDVKHYSEVANFIKNNCGCSNK